MLTSSSEGEIESDTVWVEVAPSRFSMAKVEIVDEILVKPEIGTRPV